MVLALEKMHIIGGDQAKVELSGDSNKFRIATALRFEAMIVQLDEEAIAPENFTILAGELPRPFEIACKEPAIDFALEAAAQRNDPSRVGCQQLLVNSRFIVKTLEMRGRDQLDKIAISFGIGSEQCQMERSFLTGRGVAIAKRPGCHVSLAADDWSNASPFGRLVKLYRTVEIAMVGNRNRRHSEFGGLRDQVFRSNRSVQQGVFCVAMQMNERNRSH